MIVTCTRRAAATLLLLGGLLWGSAAPLSARAESTSATAAPAPAPLSELVARTDIPYEQFTLPNGLRVVVHTDHKAPLVSVGVWYHVGSRDEPVGKAGYAHLFEHLMFYGSQHSPGEHFAPLEAIGASDFNGTTSFDRTNYFQTVPTPALDLALFLESDRMGWLLPALNQEKLDAQRKVVLNEKRQGDNRPYGLVSYALLAALFPPENPYAQSTIGRVEDLERATLENAHDWFRTHYGPNNAVLVLAGDIDVATARPLVEKWFGQIPPGPTPARFAAPLPRRAETTRQTMHDRIAAPRLIRAWAIPGLDSPEKVPLEIAMTILAGGQTSRLYETLVRDEKLAVGVSGSAGTFEKLGIATISMDLAPGVDPARAEARLDALLAEFRRNGPTADEVERVAMRAAAGTIRGLEKVGGFGGKGVVLAEGMLYSDDPGRWRQDLMAYARAQPKTVHAAAARWLAGGDHRITLLPGERDPATIETEVAPRVVARPQQPPAPWQAVGEPADRSTPPVGGAATTLNLPAIERGTLSNGIRLVVARQTSIPVVRLSLTVPIGIAGDSRDKPGTQKLMLAMFDEGSNGRLGRLDGPEIARRLERLGGAVSASATLDRTRFALNALGPNFEASLALFADLVRAPAFPADQLERVRAQALTGLKAETADPTSLAYRLLPPLLYGEEHPYGQSFTGSGTTQGLQSVTREDLVRFHQRVNPATATITVVGDTSLAAIQPQLERAFGDWKAQPVGAIVADIDAAPPPRPATGRILLVDRPGASQAVILGGAPASLTGRDDTLALELANDVYGGLLTSRLFRYLREEKGWSYGAYSGLSRSRGPMPFLIQAAVETGHVGDSIDAMRALLAAQHGERPPTSAEIDNARANMIRGLPGNMETMSALLGALERNETLERPDDYLTTLPARLNEIPDEAVANAPLPGADALLFVVVGDKSVIGSQLAATGLLVEEYRPEP